jgi:glycosyltransferase involved in cell wall biosynthesis
MLRDVADPLSVTIAVEHTRVGAAETYAFSLAAALARQGQEVDLLVPTHVRVQAAAWMAGTDVQVTVVPEGTVPRFLACCRRFARRLPAVVHANHAVSPVLIAARLTGVRARFVTDHVLPLRPTYNERGEVLQRLTRLSATDVIVFSQQNAALASNSWGRRPVHAIPAGVPGATCARDPREILRELRVPEGATIIGLVGRLTAQKRQQVLLHALARLRARGVNVHGLLVGEGEDREAIEMSVASLGLADAVTITGNREDVGCLLKATDIYTQPSAWEGMCFALLEALSAGLPCVVADLPVFHEVIGDLDVPFVPVDDEGGLMEAIFQLVTDRERARRSGLAAADRWAELYTVERMASAHESAYQARVARR